MTLDRYTVTLPEGAEAKICRVDENRETFSFRWTPGSAPEGKATLLWQEDARGVTNQWYPTCGPDRGLRTNWYPDIHTRVSCGCPVFSFLDAAGDSLLCIALSDAKTDIGCNFGVLEETGRLRMQITIPLVSFDHLGKYEVTLYLSRRQENLCRAVERVRKWWEETYPPAPVPECAKMPLYSAWYSYHQATIAAPLEAESRLAAGLGMRTIIVDDGWQTTDGNRGYSYCGDWEVTPEKIPDMRAHVEKVHETGLKYMLWYSVPFIGCHSKAWSRFGGKLLYTVEDGKTGVLDPRYPDVRQYLIHIYQNALVAWNLDGFKLDFIDSFAMSPESKPFGEGMDIPVLADAVDALMQGIRAALTAIRPDILIEFRQQYIGPLMRGYGNMFRVGDCPMSPDKNRVGMVDLRMTSGNTAVHSDMLMWDAADTPENAMRQLLNVLFCVPQISMRIAELPESHVKALSFWLGFAREHRDLLLDAPLTALLPQFLYPCVWTEKDGRCVIGVYQTGLCVPVPPDAKEVFLLNATNARRVPLNAAVSAHVETFDVTGVPVATCDCARDFIDVPPCGLAHIIIH